MPNSSATATSTSSEMYPKALLGQAEDGQERRLAVRVERPAEPPGTSANLRLPRRAAGVRGGRRRRAHRSSSPPIMLTEPKVGTMSATMPPSSIRWSAAIGGRHGGRQRTRYGRSVPSDTT